jgi:hypothetical protein
MAKKAKKANTTPALDEVSMMAIEMLEGDRSVGDAMTETTPAVLEDVVAQLDAVDEAQAEAVSEIQATVLELPATENPHDLAAWDQAIAAISQQDAIEMAHKVALAIDTRAAYESDKNPDNGNIHRTLKKARQALSLPSACKAMMVTGFDVGQVNRHKAQNARYNVYALGKLADVLNGVVNGSIGNAINNACLRSLFRFQAAGVPFTMEMAKAAASDKIRITDKNQLGALVRHTVSASTAPTQASSTMQALTDLGIVSRGGSEKNPVFSLTDAPIVSKLSAILQA